MIETKHCDEISLASVAALSLWLFCLAAGMAGLFWQMPGRSSLSSASQATQAQLVEVQLTEDSSRQLPVSAKVEAFSPPKPPPIPRTFIPALAPLISVAEPVHVEFALPVENPTLVVAASEASTNPEAVSQEAFSTEATGAASAPAVATEASAAPPKSLTYGEGEGRQPAPDYPLLAIRQGQEGRVGVQFRVGPNGRVLSAELSSPSPWPLLNHAALKAIRDRWRFATGPDRFYEVFIRFELKK